MNMNDFSITYKDAKEKRVVANNIIADKAWETILWTITTQHSRNVRYGTRRDRTNYTFN